MRSSTFLRLPLFCVLLLAFVGCGEDSNPMAIQDPGPEQPEIRTPVSLKITEIRVESYGGKGGDGNWDATVNVSGRRPDIYVTVRTGSSSSAPIYVSTVEKDAFSGVRYEFTKSSAGVGLPKTVSVNRKLTLTMMDEDIGADDNMGSYSFDPIDAYRQDNAVGFQRTYTGSNRAKFTVVGNWVY